MKRLLANTALLLGLGFAGVAQAQPTVTTPPSICSWCNLSVTWSGIVAPTSTNMLTLTTPGSETYLTFTFTNGASSGTKLLFVPGNVPFGTYVIRLYHPGHPTLAATSAPFNVVPAISGTVTSGGSPLAGVSISATSGAECNAITDASGAWGCLVPYGWSGTVTVTKPGSLFTPASRNYTNVTNHINSNNFATAASHALSGTITYEGSPLSGAAVAAGSGTSCTATNASGQYTCAVPPGWSGTVTPSMTDRVFTPASRSYTNVTAAQSAQDYTASATFYQVSGTVTLNGLPLANVALAATGGPSCTSSNGAGQYSCTVPFGWSGSVTPTATGYSFGPASRNYSSVASTQSAQTFTATLDTATAPLYFLHVLIISTRRGWSRTPPARRCGAGITRSRSGSMCRMRIPRAWERSSFRCGSRDSTRIRRRTFTTTISGTTTQVSEDMWKVIQLGCMAELTRIATLAQIRSLSSIPEGKRRSQLEVQLLVR